MGKIWSKQENKILIVLLLFSISIGLWNNFRQLWMQDNGLNATEIGNILSFGTLICVIGILIFSKYIKLDKIKKFITIALIIKIVNMFFLFVINNSSFFSFINLSIIIDIIIERLIIISIYPLILTIKKSNTLYSKRKLVEYTGRDLGVLIGGFLIGKTIIGTVINYNISLLISILFSIISVCILFNIKIENIQLKTSREKTFKYIFMNKFRLTYIIYYLIGHIAYSTALGLKMLTLTNYMNFTDSFATKYFLVVGILADIIGIVCLKRLQPKNDYITISIKFGLRFIGYTLAFLSNNIFVIIIAMTWSLLISTAYENVTDAPYINNIDADKQLAYTNFMYIVGSIGESIGIFLCGLMYAIGLKYMFGLSAIFMLIQLGLAYLLIHQRRKSYIV
ncbi:MAG: hypothetical protein RSE57_04365 [Clostridia bacterium]